MAIAKSPPRVILIRHGATEWNCNAPGSQGERVRGHIDKPLTLEGIGEAHRLAEVFQTEPIQRIHSSDLSRAYDTAVAIQEAHPWHPPIRKTKGLRPWHLGPTIEGQLVLDVLPRLMFLALVATKVQPPGGCSFHDYKLIFLPEFQRILEEAKEKPELGAHLIASHERNVRIGDGWIRAGQRGLQIDPHVILAEKHVPTGGWLEYEFDGTRWANIEQSQQVTSASGEALGGLVK